jgi:hypothetical protein
MPTPLQRRFHRRSDGVESIPLQLVILVIIIAFTIPIVMNYWMMGDRAQVENNTLSQLNYLGTTVKQINDNGIGNRDLITLDFKDGTFTKIDYIRIGGDIKQTQSALVKWRLSGAQERTYIIPGESRIGYQISSNVYKAFEIGSGKILIYLECKKTLDATPILYVEIGEAK